METWQLAFLAVLFLLICFSHLGYIAAQGFSNLGDDRVDMAWVCAVITGIVGVLLALGAIVHAIYF